MGLLKSVVFVFIFLGCQLCFAQKAPMIFGGVILDNDTFEPIQGTAILNVNRAAGAVSDSLGLFSIEALPGDTLEFNDVRYVMTTLVIPDVLSAKAYGIVQVLINKTVQLDEVKVYALPSEDRFKEVFLSLKLKSSKRQKRLRMQKSVESALKKAYENDKYYYDTWANRRLYELTDEIPPNYLLDPTRWVKFVEDFKNEMNN